MLATGGTLAMAVDYLASLQARTVTVICLLAAPEGVRALEDHLTSRQHAMEVDVVLAGLDERLDERGYIVPGLGDAGDRLYGVV